MGYLVPGWVPSNNRATTSTAQAPTSPISTIWSYIFYDPTLAILHVVLTIVIDMVLETDSENGIWSIWEERTTKIGCAIVLVLVWWIVWMVAG
jgi:hypothetical protein